MKATLNVLVFSGTAIWRVTKAGGNDINIQLVRPAGCPLPC